MSAKSLLALIVTVWALVLEMSGCITINPPPQQSPALPLVPMPPRVTPTLTPAIAPTPISITGVLLA